MKIGDRYRVKMEKVVPGPDVNIASLPVFRITDIVPTIVEGDPEIVGISDGGHILPGSELRLGKHNWLKALEKIED